MFNSRCYIYAKEFSFTDMFLGQFKIHSRFVLIAEFDILPCDEMSLKWTILDIFFRKVKSYYLHFQNNTAFICKL